MKNKIIIIAAILLIAVCITAQEDKFYYENAVYNENIKTVVMHRKGFELSNPLIMLNEPAQLIFKFDDFSEDGKDYYYTVVHCDPD